MKAINKEAKEILNKILGNIVPIKALNNRVVKVKYSKHCIRIEKRSFNNQGHIIILSTIVRNGKCPYDEIPRIGILKLFKDADYYPVYFINTKTNQRIIAAEISKNGKEEYKCNDLLIQGIITDFTDLHLVIINNSKILD